MAELFGTDGIRGKVNQYPMTPEMALKTGKAAAIFFRAGSGHDRPKIVIGKDTRLSGDMIESALISGLCAMGADAFLTGVLPTPGIAHLTKHLQADAGIVVSASHNPFHDNGIKFFNKQGFKLSDAVEKDMESLILNQKPIPCDIKSEAIGKVHHVPEAVGIYSDFLAGHVTPETKKRLGKLTVAMDCANGATSAIAPALFSRLGVDVVPLAMDPDGVNINDACGSQYPELLAETVLASRSDIGFAFDGDGDRVIAVDETGNVLTGDQLIAIFTHFFQKQNKLTHQTVVTTVMSNIGLSKALSDMQVTHLKSAVGDRYVMEKMVSSRAVLGGEDSGHIIFLNTHTTGDGLLAALHFLCVMVAEKMKASQLGTIMKVFPQVLMNVDVRIKPDIDEIQGLSEGMAKVEHQLGETGRVLIRYSGTQPMCRVMVEAETHRDAEKYCSQLADIINKEIGA